MGPNASALREPIAVTLQLRSLAAGSSDGGGGGALTTPGADPDDPSSGDAVVTVSLTLNPVAPKPPKLGSPEFLVPRRVKNRHRHTEQDTV